MLAITGLTITEFGHLIPFFQKAWDEYLAQNFIERDGRKRLYGGVRPKSTLITIEDKLLFILYYVKAYPLQEIIAYEFGMAQSTANEWIHILSAVLKNALNAMGHLPERKSDQSVESLMNESERIYGIDGTERPIQRSKEIEAQKKYYSGKKKSHTVKNIRKRPQGKHAEIIEEKK